MSTDGEQWAEIISQWETRYKKEKARVEDLEVRLEFLTKALDNAQDLGYIKYELIFTEDGQLVESEFSMPIVGKYEAEKSLRESHEEILRMLWDQLKQRNAQWAGLMETTTLTFVTKEKG